MCSSARTNLVVAVELLLLLLLLLLHPLGRPHSSLACVHYTESHKHVYTCTIYTAHREKPIYDIAHMHCLWRKLTSPFLCARELAGMCVYIGITLRLFLYSSSL